MEHKTSWRPATYGGDLNHRYGLMPLSPVSDTLHSRQVRLYYQLRPAVRTFASIAVLLGLILSTFVLLLAWVRTPQGLYLATDSVAPRVVRGGESLRTVLPWAMAQLLPAVAMVLAGLAGLLLTGDTEPDAPAA